jgi:hypothetical protein
MSFEMCIRYVEIIESHYHYRGQLKVAPKERHACIYPSAIPDSAPYERRSKQKIETLPSMDIELR